MKQNYNEQIAIIKTSISECISLAYTDNDGCMREICPYALLVFSDYIAVWAVNSAFSESEERFSLFIPKAYHQIKSTNSTFIPDKWNMNYLETSFSEGLKREKLIGSFRIFDERLI